jgi:predicted transcriptional regulator
MKKGARLTEISAQRPSSWPILVPTIVKSHMTISLPLPMLPGESRRTVRSRHRAARLPRTGPVFSLFGAEVRVTCVNRLGELERAIMDVLWDSTEPLTVRQVGLRLINRDLAHTTVMTVLDRLAKKGFARRQREGRAWLYQAAANREAYVTELMLHALDQTGDRSAALASFARRVSDSEAEVLRRALESLGELPRD